MPNNGCFIPMPLFLQLNKQKLKYLDALIYITIRSFYNTGTGECYPAYEAIAKLSGMGRTFVASSIARLKGAGLFTITKVRKRNDSYV